MEALGGSVLAALFQVLFDRMASSEVVDSVQGRRLTIALLKKLNSLMNSVNAVLDDAEEKQVSKPAVKMWLDELKDAVFEADDLFDEISYRALRARLESPSQNSIRQATHLFSSLNPLKRGMKWKLEDVLRRIEYLVKQKDALGLRHGIGENPSLQRLPSTSLVDESGVYGRDGDKRAIMGMLLSDYGSHNAVGVIPIVGMGGVGKTTLAQIVYNDNVVRERFDLMAWVCVSKEADVSEVTKDILEEVTGRKCFSTTLNQLQVMLKEKLNGKKFLLVLDDVWNDKYAHWDILLRPLKSGTEGSKVVVTTRHETVASVMGTVVAYHLRELSDDDCWCLFLKHVFEEGKSGRHIELELIGREMVRKCRGLPLAAKTLAGLLRAKTDVAEWERVLKSDMWDLSNEDILPALRLSYHYLPSHLKQCFAYCALFPKDYVFEKEELVLLWMAEDFLVLGKECKTMEEVGGEYFHDLVARSFFQRSSVYPSCFIMHDLVNDLAKFVAGEFWFRLEGDDSREIGKRTRHLSYTSVEHDVSKKLESFQGAQLLRTFLLVEWSQLDEDVMRGLLQKFSRLRVLSLCCYRGLSELPKSLSKLKHLRYMNLSGSSIRRLPATICKLYNLQTLILFECKELVVLPTNMGRLINLLHLDIRGTNLKNMPPQIGQLRKLLRLSDFVVGIQGDCSIKELGELQHLQEQLRICSLQNVTIPRDALQANLKGKKNIKKLKLEWDNGDGDFMSHMEVLEQLQPHRNIESLSIDGYGGSRFPAWVGDFYYSNMVSLKLTGCWQCSSLPPLGQLVSLEDLWITGFDQLVVVGPDVYGNCLTKKPPFASLKSLTFELMPKWQEWNDECGAAFPLLQELYIRECPALTGALPGHLPSLTTLKIEGCPQLVASLPRSPDILRLHLKDNNRLMRFVKPCSFGLYHLIIEGFNCIDSLLQDMEQMCGLTSSLQEIEIKNCCEVKIFPVEMFPELKTLRFSSCPRLQRLFPPEANNDYLKNLSSLEIMDCPGLGSFLNRRLPAPNLSRFMLLGCSNLASFPGEKLLPSTLTSLKIGDFQNLTSLDFTGLRHLTGLRELEICNCPKLRSLPDEGLPFSLSSLSVFLCPLLEHRCQPYTGEDWPKICHIPHIEISFFQISCQS
ncbi:unnamed protein product [Linum tenue]|uniref:Disease resistance RPP13-like protein 1 n=1 Tax=Linum tenue TaxID=586396 RepID=A0AAV0NTA7_9ROSI|nr:unnamed protein product [Linum tenue]